MLTRIWSEAFKEDTEPREVISFHPGLNTIRGGQGAENSIGKSTMLYIIDYAFGGKKFLSTDTLKPKGVGHHRICFTFEFNGRAHHFARHTNEHDYVHLYSDQTWQHETERWDVKDFQEWLKRNYGLDECVSSFREIISRFFRIKQQATAHGTEPLHGYSREPVSTGISVLYQLFDLYEQIKDLQDAEAKANEDWKAINRTRNLDFPVLALRTKAAYEKAKREVHRLDDEYESNIKGADQEALDFQADQLSQAARLKTFLQSQRSQRRRLEAKITQLQANLEEESSISFTSTDIEALAQLFPGINLVTIIEAQTFHRKIGRILTEETRQQLKDLENRAQILESSIKEAEYQLRQTGVPVEISRERLDKGANIKAQREVLAAQTDTYERIAAFKETKTEASRALDEGRAEINRQLVKIINPVIADLDRQVHGGEDDWDAPELTFSATGKSYEYKSDTDGGDGTTNKNLILFDLAMLHLTDLPAVIHDSPLHKNIADDRVEQILRLYMDFNNTHKQIFIAFDKDTQYEGTHVHDLIQASKVIEIGDGDQALYGWTWNKTRKDKKK